MKNNKPKIQKIMSIAVFVFVGILICIIFATSTTYSQLIIASLMYPLFAYLVFTYFPSGKGKKGASSRGSDTLVIGVNQIGKDKNGVSKRKHVELMDINKRAFLKMVGGVGLSFLIFSLFSKRLEGLIGSGSQRQTYPADYASDIKVRESYKISETLFSDYNYYGFVNQEGAWYIMREDPLGGSYRYAKGESNFLISWEKVEKLKYDLYHKVFDE